MIKIEQIFSMKFCLETQEISQDDGKFRAFIQILLSIEPKQWSLLQGLQIFVFPPWIIRKPNDEKNSQKWTFESFRENKREL